jgi:hypothetical protein
MRKKVIEDDFSNKTTWPFENQIPAPDVYNYQWYFFKTITYGFYDENLN